MDSYIALMLFGSFFILVFIGVPISFSIGIATVGSMLLMFPWDIAVITVSQRLANGLDNFALLAIPFFIFAGTLMNSGGIAIRLINLAQVMVGRVPGSLGHVNVLANMMFGSISGSAVAAAAAVGHAEPHSDAERLRSGFLHGGERLVVHHGPAYSAVKRADRLFPDGGRRVGRVAVYGRLSAGHSDGPGYYGGLCRHC
jgi:hypothetical protein